MTEDRNLGVTEARVGLTMITCLLLVLGYVVLQQLGGTGQRPPVEVRADQPTVPLETTELPSPGDVERPFVLQPESWDPTGLPIQTTQRPEWVMPQDDVGTDSAGMFDPLGASASEFGASPLEPTDPWRASRSPDPLPIR